MAAGILSENIITIIYYKSNIIKKRIFHNIEDNLLDYNEYLTKKDNQNKEKGIALIETIYIDEGGKDYLTYQIISREVAATLTKVIRYYFPQHFGQE